MTAKSLFLGIATGWLAVAAWGIYNAHPNISSCLVTLDEQAVPPVLRNCRLSKRGEIVSTETSPLYDLKLKRRNPAKQPSPLLDEWIPDAVLSPKRDKIAVWVISGPKEERIDILTVKSGRLVSVIRATRGRMIVHVAWIDSDTIRYAERHDGRRFTLTDVRVDTNPPRVIKATTLPPGEPFSSTEDRGREMAASWYRQLGISGPPGLRPGDPLPIDFTGHSGNVSQDGKTAALWSSQNDAGSNSIVVVREKRVVGRFPIAAADYVAQVMFVDNLMAVRFERTRPRIVILSSAPVKQTAELPDGIIVRLK